MTVEDRAAEFCHRAGYTVPGDTYGKLCRMLHAAIREAIAEEREGCVEEAEGELCESAPGYKEAVAVSNTTANAIVRAIRARGDAT